VFRYRCTFRNGDDEPIAIVEGFHASNDGVAVAHARSLQRRWAAFRTAELWTGDRRVAALLQSGPEHRPEVAADPALRAAG
jgi:hypothetical protein